MQKLVSELSRLYLSPGAISPAVLTERMLGQSSEPVSLASPGGGVRAIMIPFQKMSEGEDSRHWTRLCELANALQAELGLPAPAVSISSSDGFGLWLSLAWPAPAETVREFVSLLRAVYCSGADMPVDAGGSGVALPPCLDQGTGKWAAFINPGLGASFAEDSGLEMAPPLSGQVALLEHLHSITEAQLAHAIGVMRQAQAGHGGGSAIEEAPPVLSASGDGLLLKDATLEDIVRHLHGKNIEPSFRHLLKR